MLKFSSRPFVIPGFKVIENALNLFRIAVEEIARYINRSPIVHGNLVTDIQFTPSTISRIYHKLNRIPQGFIITRVVGTNAQYKQIDSSSTYMDIYSYTDAQVDIWFF